MRNFLINSLIFLFILKFLWIFFTFMISYIYSIRMRYNDAIRNNVSISLKSSQSKSTSKSRKYKICISNILDGLIKYTLRKTAYLPSHWLRRVIYKKIFLVNIEEKAIIYYGVQMKRPCNISIGKGSIIGDNSIIDGRCGLSIGNNVNISSNVHIWTGQHNINDINFSFEGGSVRVDDRAWISDSVIVLPGIHIGKGAVVAGGAVVTKDVEPYTIYAGIPAKKIGERNKKINYILDGKHDWFY